MHESVWRGTLGDASVGNADPRGEYVIVIDQGAPAPEATDDQLTAAVVQALANGMSKKDAAAHVARLHGVGRNRVYDLATSV
jgi:16S rRNA C1402 (ribose-2'-O) methylase RsmI